MVKSQKKGFMIIKNFLKQNVFFLALIVFNSCDDDAVDSQLPYVYVNAIININNIQYDDLRTRGFTYLQEGYRGIILYHQPSGGFRAFERACTFQPEDVCGIVEVHVSGFYMEDPCCSSTFDFEGFPTSGPARVRLREYFTFLDGTILTISSEPF
jgi:hypothetical protein